jgi:hypothetical protein
MDDEFDDKGWDGDMGDGEVSKIIGILCSLHHVLFYESLSWLFPF